ncbi:MAG: nucleotidyltransferase [Deltaproteobacteria bacterium]|nr:nucleotidyltransferase [Deltaproteobacteria bacterium]
MTYGAADLERIFGDQLRTISRALSALGADYMLIGGLAVGVWGEPRATKDADFCVHVMASADDLRAGLATAGLEVARGDLDRALAQGESVRLRRIDARDEPVAVDLLLAVTPFEIEALGRRRPLSVLGVELPVVAPEDLFVFKLIAGRPQDLADAALLHDLHGETFDRARVRRWCREFGVEERLASFPAP